MKRKVGKWYGIDVCPNCNERLSFCQVMDSNGVCPHCGHAARSTVCAHKTVVLRKVKTWTGKWWQFWKVDTTYEYKESK